MKDNEWLVVARAFVFHAADYTKNVIRGSTETGFRPNFDELLKAIENRLMRQAIHVLSRISTLFAKFIIRPQPPFVAGI